MNIIANFLVFLILLATPWIFPTLGSFILSLVTMGLLGLLMLASCFIHRIWFARLLAKDGFRLVTFNDRSAFVSWSTPPRWWEYRVVYFGTAAARSGDVADCSMSISGALFALIQPKINVSVEMPGENEIWLAISLELTMKRRDDHFAQFGRQNDLFAQLERLATEGLASFRCHRSLIDRQEISFALEPDADTEKALQIVIDGLKVVDCLHLATVKTIGFEHCDDKLTRFEKNLWPRSGPESEQ